MVFYKRKIDMNVIKNINDKHIKNMCQRKEDA